MAAFEIEGEARVCKNATACKDFVVCTAASLHT